MGFQFQWTPIPRNYGLMTLCGIIHFYPLSLWVAGGLTVRNSYQSFPFPKEFLPLLPKEIQINPEGIPTNTPHFRWNYNQSCLFPNEFELATLLTLLTLNQSCLPLEKKLAECFWLVLSDPHPNGNHYLRAAGFRVRSWGLVTDCVELCTSPCGFRVAWVYSSFPGIGSGSAPISEPEKLKSSE